jgi:hypothetical protein
MLEQQVFWRGIGMKVVLFQKEFSLRRKAIKRGFEWPLFIIIITFNTRGFEPG